MSKRIEQDGKFYRMRRGKLVEIPSEWVGRHPTVQTIRNRLSKLPGPLKRVMKAGGGVNRYKDARDQLRSEGTDE